MESNEPLSDKEIETFITTFKSYIERASVSELNYLRRESNRKYRQMYYTNQAKKHNVSLDYYNFRVYLGVIMSRKYRVEQYYTTGWSVVHQNAIKLSKDEARKWLEKMLAEGVNPDELRAIPD